MIGRPEANEAAPYYFTYIDRITSDDILSVLDGQLEKVLPLLRGISEEKSMYRYAADKWSIRQVLSHINDCERMFLFRALWFARGFDSPLPSFDQNIAIAGADADKIPLERHIQEFQAIRASTLLFFRHLPADAWMRTGIASGNPFTVRALSYIAAGQAEHHVAILRERYL
jgi:hypothetical protein